MKLVRHWRRRDMNAMGNDEPHMEHRGECFHQLKTYYHAKHCYCHGASEANM